MALPLILANLISAAYDTVHQGSNDDTSKAFHTVLSKLSKSKSKDSDNSTHAQQHSYESNLQTPKLF